MMRVTLSGYYGFNNAGDDAVCESVIAALRQEMPEVDITLLSNEPQASRSQFGVDAVNRWQVRAAVKALWQSDLLISGGGSLLQDVTSKRGFWYYLAVILLARLMRVPVLVYGQGVGPLTDGLNRRLTAAVLNRTQAVTVRDMGSRNLLKDIGVRQPVLLTADPVLGFAPEGGRPVRTLLAQAGIYGDRPLIICAPRPWQEVDRVKAFAGGLDALVQKGYAVALLPMQPEEDLPLCQAIVGHMTERAHLLTDRYTLAELFDMLATADLVIAMRLHALIIGAASNCALLALPYDPKVSAFMARTKAGLVLPLADLTAEELSANAQAALVLGACPEERLGILRNLARLPAVLAKKMINPRR